MPSGDVRQIVLMQRSSFILRTIYTYSVYHKETPLINCSDSVSSSYGWFYNNMFPLSKRACKLDFRRMQRKMKHNRRHLVCIRAERQWVHACGVLLLWLDKRITYQFLHDKEEPLPHTVWEVFHFLIPTRPHLCNTHTWPMKIGLSDISLQNVSQ